MTTTDILKGELPDLNSMEDLRALWFVVYDGPVAWEGRTAFEEIQYLQAALLESQDPMNWPYGEAPHCHSCDCEQG